MKICLFPKNSNFHFNLLIFTAKHGDTLVLKLFLHSFLRESKNFYLGQSQTDFSLDFFSANSKIIYWKNVSSAIKN